MPSLNGQVAVSKAAILTGSLMVGTGTIYLLYQMYTISRQLKRFNCQITILTDRLYRTEADVLQLRHFAEQATASGDVEQAVISDDADDEFVDAEDDEKDELKIMINGPSSNHVNRSRTKLNSILADQDSKIEEGGIENLKKCQRHLIEISKSYPKDAEVFWRIAETAFLLAEEELLSGDSSSDKNKELMFQAKKAAEKSISLNPKTGYPYKWMAIILGSLTQHMPVGDQIKNAFDIKEYIERAIFHLPDDSLMHHIMGRWCYSVYMMTWMERKMASVLFATPPTATLGEAIGFLQKAESLDPGASISNKLYLAKAFIADGDYKTAVKYLKSGEKLPCDSLNDQKARDEIQTLVQQYSSYGSSS